MMISVTVTDVLLLRGDKRFYIKLLSTTNVNANAAIVEGIPKNLALWNCRMWEKLEKSNLINKERVFKMLYMI